MDKRIRKLEERSIRHIERQRYDKAVEDLRELVDLDAGNPRWLHKLGEAHRRAGDTAEAVEAFGAAAERNAEQGHLLKAIAQCKMVLDLDPGHTHIQGMLASLYAQKRAGSPLRGRATTTGISPHHEAARAPWEAPPAAEAGERGPVEPAAREPLEPPELPTAESAGHAPARSAADELLDETPSTTGVGELSYEHRPAGSRIEESEWVAPGAASGEFRRPEAISLVLDAPPVDDSGEFGGEEVQDLFDPGLRELGGSPDWTTRSLSAMSSTPPDLDRGDTLDSIELRRMMEELEEEISEPGESVVLEIHLDDEEGGAEPEWPEQEAGADDGDAGDASGDHEPATATQILAEMPDVPLFSSLDAGALRMMIERVAVRVFEPGDWIVRQGSPGHSLFVVVEGEVEVYREGAPRVELGVLGEGAFFGEVSVVTEGERAATVQARTEGYALELTRDVIGEVVREHPDVLKQLLRFFRMRMIDLLVETHELFRPFAGDDREELERQFTFIEAATGAELLREGEHGDGLYILVSGRAEVRRGGEWLGELQAGDMVGEPSLLTGRPSAVTVHATGKCWLLKLDRAFFRDHVMKHPEVLRLVGELAEKRRKQQECAEKGEGFETFSLTLY